MNRFFVVGSLLLLVLFAAVCFHRPEIADWNLEQVPAKERLSPGELRRQFDRLQADYDADCEQLLRDFTKRLETESAGEFSCAKRAVPDVVNHLCRVKCSAKLCYKLAKDKVTGSSDFTDAYLAILDEPVIQPCLRANHIAGDLLQALELRLRERHAKYNVDAAFLCGENNSGVELPRADLTELRKSLSAFIGKCQTLHLTQAGATVGTAFELLFIRQSCSMIGKLFAKPAARIGSSLGVGALCAAADGPVPVGDIVGGVLAVGGIAWTAWDIYLVVKVMPRELTAELDKGIAAAEKTLQEESRGLAENLVKSYRSSGAAIRAQLEEQLNS